MTMKIRAQFVNVIALIAFVVIGAQLVWDFQVWECACSNEECEWCKFEEDGCDCCTTEVQFTWEEFYLDSYVEHFDAFTRHFESLTYKRTSNGRSMVNGKFVKMS